MIDLVYVPWIRLILVIFIVVVFSGVLVKLFISILKRFATFTKTDKDDNLVEKLEKPLMLLVGLFALRFGLEILGFWQSRLVFNLNLIDSISLLVIARIISLVVYLLFEIWSVRLKANKRIHIDEQIIVMIDRSLGFIIYIITFGYVLAVWNIDIWPVLGSLGIAGVALAFALQETLKNVFGGIQLILDRNFTRGDIIELSDGTAGRIYDITLRSTRIRTWDNKLVIIPNAVMANDIIRNVSKPDRSRRLEVKFGVEYGTDTDYVRHVVLEEIKKIEWVEKKDPVPRVLFKEMADSSLNFIAWFWIKNPDDYLNAKEEGTTRIYERLNKEGIGIPFPQVTVWANDMGKPHIRPYRKRKIRKK